ncbi:MAG: DUF2062 domain-containing protein, partial [Rhizobiaceae bacterium]
FFGNPITFPIIWATTYQTGQVVLQTQQQGGEAPALGAAMKGVMQACMKLDGTAALSALGDIWFPLLYPMLVGGLIVGPLVAVPIYFITRRAAGVFREKRRNKLMAKATEIRDKAKHLAAQSNISNKAEQA